MYVTTNQIGISSLSSCADPERLPELPPGEEQRLQRAAFHLQQKLVLREWLKENHLEQYYARYSTRKITANPQPELFSHDP